MKILLPVDGSAHALNAVRYVADRLMPLSPDAELHLLHVRFRIPLQPGAALGPAKLQQYYQGVLEEAVKTARDLLDRRKIRYKLMRTAGHPGAEIARVAEDMHVDLVVMGSHGRGAATALLLGSSTQGVIAGCEVPLLVIRDKRLPESRGEVLVAVDGSAYSRKAVAYLLRHRDMLGASSHITLMHVSPSMPRFTVAKARLALQQQREREREQAMHSARRLLAKVSGIKCREVHVTGDPGERLADYARGHHCSLIVMGSHGRGGITRLLLGSVAQKTLAAGRTPVLIVR
ncbi:MAG: universal stress protein [Burkholderiales bacterium]|nr:universal stress protein [Burkholderiales bacterium]